MLVEAYRLPRYPIFNDLVPPEGSKGIPLLLDFTADSHYEISAGWLVSRGFFEICQTIWIDTTDATASVTVTVNGTGQQITVLANTQGYYPVACANQFGLSFDSASASTVRVILLNMPIQAHQITVVSSEEDAMVFLGSVTAAASATLDLTSLITTTYQTYILLAESLIVSIAGSTIRLRVSTDNGATFKQGAADYNWQETAIALGSAASAADTAIQLINATGAGIPISFWFRFNDPLNAAIRTAFVGDGSSNGNGWNIAGERLLAEADNAIRLFPSAGTFTSGKLSLFGIKTS